MLHANREASEGFLRIHIGESHDPDSRRTVVNNWYVYLKSQSQSGSNGGAFAHTIRILLNPVAPGNACSDVGSDPAFPTSVENSDVAGAREKTKGLKPKGSHVTGEEDVCSVLESSVRLVGEPIGSEAASASDPNGQTVVGRLALLFTDTTRSSTEVLSNILCAPIRYKLNLAYGRWVSLGLCISSERHTEEEDNP